MKPHNLLSLRRTFNPSRKDTEFDLSITLAWKTNIKLLCVHLFLVLAYENMHCPHYANGNFSKALLWWILKLIITSFLQDLNIPDISESSTVDAVSRIQKTTAYGESIGPSHPSCSGSGSQLQWWILVSWDNEGLQWDIVDPQELRDGSFLIWERILVFILLLFSQ